MTVTAPATVPIDVTAALAIGAGYVLDQLQAQVEQAIGSYLLSIRQTWDAPTPVGLTAYSSWVYVARLTAAILQVGGVVNATGVTLNGGTADIQLTEDGQTQQVPVLGKVVLTSA